MCSDTESNLTSNDSDFDNTFNESLIIYEDNQPCIDPTQYKEVNITINHIILSMIKRFFVPFTFER